MNYLKLVRNAMRLHDAERFTGNQLLLYVVLVEQFNRAGEGDKWPESLRFQDPMLSALTGVSINKMKEFRLELQTRNLIDFKEPGQGSRTGTEYWLGAKRSSETDEVKSKRSSERLSETDEVNPKDRQKDHQKSRQKDCQKLTRSYIYSIPNYPNLQTPKRILSVAGRDDASVWQVILWNLQRKKKARPKAPPVPPAPPGIPFSVWYDAYDKKRDPKECEAEWGKLTDEQRQAALTHTGRYTEATPKQYRKDPIRYLKKQSWNDEIIQRHATTQQTRNGHTQHRTEQTQPYEFDLDRELAKRAGRQDDSGSVVEGDFELVE